MAQQVTYEAALDAAHDVTELNRLSGRMTQVV
jgi:hypothetical protein